jgi:hypothetical protein
MVDGSKGVQGRPISPLTEAFRVEVVPLDPALDDRGKLSSLPWQGVFRCCQLWQWLKLWRSSIWPPCCLWPPCRCRLWRCNNKTLGYMTSVKSVSCNFLTVFGFRATRLLNSAFWNKRVLLCTCPPPPHYIFLCWRVFVSVHWILLIFWRSICYYSWHWPFCSL